MTPNEWILSDDTGISSKTIWAVMMGVMRSPQQCGFKYNTPKDPDDFGRCHRLLILIPEWRKRLDEVAFMFPKWKPMIDRWDELEALWISETAEGNRAPLLYALMQKLDEKCMLADGWIRTSPSSWERKPE